MKTEDEGAGQDLPLVFLHATHRSPLQHSSSCHPAAGTTPGTLEAHSLDG